MSPPPDVTHLVSDGRRLVVGAAMVRERDGVTELLAARRNEPPELAGGWELPGGKVEPGELGSQALQREISEELGVTITVDERVPGPDDGGWPLGTTYLMRVHLVRRWTGGEPEPLEQHDALKWVPLHRWQSVAWLEGDIAPVAAVARLLSGGPA